MSRNGFIKIEGYNDPILMHGQTWPSIMEMTVCQPMPERAACKKISEEGKATVDLVMALYCDYRMNRIGIR